MSALAQKRTSQHASEQSPGFLAIPSHTMAIGLGAAGGGKHNQPLSRILFDVRFGSKADIRTPPRSFGPLGRAPDETGHRPPKPKAAAKLVKTAA